MARRLLWSQIDRPPAYRPVWFPVIYKVAVAIPLALAVISGAVSVRAVHAARTARQEACAAKLDAWRARNPALARALPSRENACAVLDDLTGER